MRGGAGGVLSRPARPAGSRVTVPESTPTTPTPPLLLVTAMYPPAVGGSAVLFENVYSRCRDARVVVLTDDLVQGSRSGGAITAIEHCALATPHWGLSHPRGIAHHLAAARAIRRWARRLGSGTAVHCGRVLPEGVAARLARMAGGSPFACWVHGEDLATARSSRELTWVTEWVLKAASVVFANSHNTKAFVGTFGVPADRIEVVHPGVDRQRFHPHHDGRPIRSRHGLDDAMVLLSVGRLQARKGHDVMLQAVAALRHRWPSLRYVIVGDGEEREVLRRLTEQLELTDRVLFVGQVADDDLAGYFAACDVFTMPNRVEGGDFEGFGIVFLEAAACGKPVVGGASGGVVEAVADGETGLLVDGASVAAVVDALDRLLSSPDLRQRMGDAGREWAGRFSWEAAAASVMAAHRRPR
jgi:phosphatidylinositol alpha-1,6-mannosyltransferase